jgi:hypothetical protein
VPPKVFLVDPFLGQCVGMLHVKQVVLCCIVRMSSDGFFWKWLNILTDERIAYLLIHLQSYALRQMIKERLWLLFYRTKFLSIFFGPYNYLYAYTFCWSINIVLEFLILFRPRCYIRIHRHVSHFVSNFENLLST